VESPRHSDLRRILDFVADAETAALSDRQQITQLILGGLGALIPCDITLLTDADHPAPTITAATDPGLPELRRRDPELWLTCVRHHPSVLYFDRTGDRAARRFSDLVSHRAYQQLPLYQYFFRPFAVEHKLDVRLYASDTHILDLGWCRERRDFADSDRALVDALSPYLTAIIRRAEAGAVAAEVRQAFGLSHREAEVLALVARAKSNPEIAGTLFLSVATVRKHVEHLYAKLGVSTRTQAVARALQARHASSNLAEPVMALIRDTGATSLVALYALTDREVQVLALARAGDTNPEIAATLRVAPETVKKHLDHVYRKLGVDGRAAATGRAVSLGIV
jgi:DNA-binding CsgD family transcriptional regulator